MSHVALRNGEMPFLKDRRNANNVTATMPHMLKS